MRWVAIWRINHVVEKVFCYNITISWNNEIPSSDRVILQILEAYYLQFNAWYALFQSMISVLQNEMVVVFFFCNAVVNNAMVWNLKNASHGTNEIQNKYFFGKNSKQRKGNNVSYYN